MTEYLSHNTRKWILRIFVIFVVIFIFTTKFLTMTMRRNVMKDSKHWQQPSESSSKSLGTASGTNMEFGCWLNNQPICCAALDDSLYVDSAHNETLSSISTVDRTHCNITREYIPSTYEKRHFQKSQQIARNTSESVRLEEYLSFAYSEEEVELSKKWLERVRVHSLSDELPVITEDDEQLMSRFLVTRTCKPHSGATTTVLSTQSWLEWIEPLSIHTRHPFGGSRCSVKNKDGQSIFDLLTNRTAPLSSVLNTDYILVQSRTAQYNNTVDKVRRQGGKRSVRNFLLDAGTSSFDSSLVWFMCMYLQRSLAFDELFGWESGPLDPEEFWSKVPPTVKSRYHFFNIGARANVTDPDSPLHVIKEVATQEDFVSFKLDSDTPEVEMDIALQLLRNPALSALVDEFFFELHFRCEVMTRCGWGADRIPKEIAGFVLDRPSVLNLFHSLRKLGIRAHIWP